VVGPKNRLPRRRFPEIREALAASADELSARLGHGTIEETRGRRGMPEERLSSGGAAINYPQGGTRPKNIVRRK
jgi:hypothetical protein